MEISNFKEKLAAFSMKTTDSKDLAKVNQILPIMQDLEETVAVGEAGGQVG